MILEHLIAIILLLGLYWLASLVFEGVAKIEKLVSTVIPRLTKYLYIPRILR
jgi:hypothetical protein